jgi:hypothetical protein
MRDAARVDWATKTVRRGGTPQWRVATRLARRHVVEHRDAGMTYERIGRAAGVAASTVHRLTIESPCSNLVAAAVLAVPVP